MKKFLKLTVFAMVLSAVISMNPITSTASDGDVADINQIPSVSR